MPCLCHVHAMMRMLHRPLLTEALHTSNHPRKATSQTVKAEKEVKAEQIALHSKMCGAGQGKMNTKQIHKMFRIAAQHGGHKKKALKFSKPILWGLHSVLFFHVVNGIS